MRAKTLRSRKPQTGSGSVEKTPHAKSVEHVEHLVEGLHMLHTLSVCQTRMQLRAALGTPNAPHTSHLRRELRERRRAVQRRRLPVTRHRPRCQPSRPPCIASGALCFGARCVRIMLAQCATTRQRPVAAAIRRRAVRRCAVACAAAAGPTIILIAAPPLRQRHQVWRRRRQPRRHAAMSYGPERHAAVARIAATCVSTPAAANPVQPASPAATCAATRRNQRLLVHFQRLQRHPQRRLPAA
eukprot:363761-Chlamydomonas_euryale.AAC.2